MSGSGSAFLKRGFERCFRAMHNAHTRISRKQDAETILSINILQALRQMMPIIQIFIP
jgi:hypothetical protein